MDELFFWMNWLILLFIELFLQFTLQLLELMSTSRFQSITCYYSNHKRTIPMFSNVSQKQNKQKTSLPFIYHIFELCSLNLSTYDSDYVVAAYQKLLLTHCTIGLNCFRSKIHRNNTSLANILKKSYIPI